MEEELAELVDRRRTISLRAERSDEIGWTEVDIGHGGFSYEKTPNGHDFISFNLRHSPLFRPILLRDIFLKFVTVDLVEEILGDMRPEDFLLNGNARSLSRNPGLVYKALAVQIRIHGTQSTPKENEKNDRPLRKSTKSSIAHFVANTPLASTMGTTHWKR